QTRITTAIQISLNKPKLKIQTVFFVINHKNAPKKCLTFWGQCTDRGGSSFICIFAEILIHQNR
ncbi:hypothetical protein, partial [Dyadobacter linearis]|uniref:hypothetical protein n=1 Tax=Dyadobacter linearis TaxID=2823330 RepID=UPI001BFC91C3